MKSQKSFLSFMLIAALWVVNASAYEVWMGTHLSTHTMAITPTSWSLTASKLEGININRAPHDTDPATTTDWKSMLPRYTNAGTKMVEIARSEPTKNPALVDELAFPAIDAELAQKFQEANNYNYSIDYLMFYDNSSTYQGTTYFNNWTAIEAQHIRDWLDANGRANVKLMYDVRNNSTANRNWALSSIVDHILIEASTTTLLANGNNLLTFVDWFWNNAALVNKRLFFQIPRTQDSITQFRGTRRVAQVLGGMLGYGDTGMRSSRLVFLPVTYNDNYPYIPETVSNGTAYTNTLTSICLSLIEQRQLFEGRLANLPTVADADSMVRTSPPSITAIANQTVAENTATAAIPFTIADTDTPLASLTVSATSSNAALVPTAGIVFGGSGANRTVTITPAAGQMGSSVITVVVNDGLWNATTTFTFTVGRFLFSGVTDANVKDDLTVVDQTLATTWTGSGGSSPFVDRSTVYVFQLPDLGAMANPFVSSSFTFNFDSKTGTVPNIDLYGLGRRDSATVLGSDHYGQSTTSDPTDATRFQTSILTNTTSLGLVGTSSGGSAALQTYLNAQYASGAGIGKYVFLRLSSTVPKNGANRATLTMSEGGVTSPTDTRPRIIFATNSAPTISSIADTTTTLSTATAAIPFTVGDDVTAAGSLTVTATSSNTTIVPNAGIVLGGSGANRTVTLTPATGQAGTSVITLQVSDGTRTTSTTFTLTVFRSILSSASDAEVQATLNTTPYSVVNAGAITLGMGTAGSTVGSDRCAVLPLQLPNLGAVANPFTAVAFTANHESNSVSPIGNVSVYGLGSRAAPTVLTTDYWAATPSLDTTDATLLQTVLIPNASTAYGLKTTDATGSANLLAYLNAQYAGGVGAGKYVFLRLASDTVQTGGSSRYRITSAEGAAAVSNNALWPQISYTSSSGNTPPTISDITNRSISTNTATGAVAFTVGDAETAAGSLTVTGTSSNTTLVPNANIVFGGSGANRTVTITPAANQSGSATITVTVSDGTLTANDTFVLTVNTTNTAPTISSIANQTTGEDTATAALSFIVGDAETAATALTVTAVSSDTTLVPNANIVLGGSGANRTVTVTPAADQNGAAIITLTVSDGSLTATSAFAVNVFAIDDAPTISAIANATINENAATAAIPFTIGDIDNDVNSLTLTGTSSNFDLVPNANIVFGGSGTNRTVTITPTTAQNGSTTITITVGDGELSANTTFTLIVFRSLLSDLADSAPRKVDTDPSPSILTSTATDTTLYAGRGGTGGTVDRCVVFPFQLPPLGATATPFASATLTFNLVSNNFSPTICNLDLYGLATRASPTVLATDYYSETDVADPTVGAARLQDNLCTATTTAGLITTSAGGNSALVNYLNAQYANGTNAGKYVFLRLSKDTANGANTKQYLVTSADGAASNNALWPKISYTTVPANTPPTIADIADHSIAVNSGTGAIAFTIGDSQTAPASLTLSKTSSNLTLVPAANIVFGGSDANRTVTVTPAANKLGASTITVTVSDGTLTASDTFIITVTGTAVETWRFTHFGTTTNTGTAADTFDSNNDGESNLLEFATGQNPNFGTLTSTPLDRNGVNLEFTYTRSNAALADGVFFVAEWSDTLAAESWSNIGVTEQVLTNNGTVQTVKATFPAGTAGRRFVHLKVVR